MLKNPELQAHHRHKLKSGPFPEMDPSTKDAATGTYCNWPMEDSHSQSVSVFTQRGTQGIYQVSTLSPNLSKKLQFFWELIFFQMAIHKKKLPKKVTFEEMFPSSSYL